MIVIFMALLGALLWRIRGGLIEGITGKKNWMGFNDTAVRAIWSIGMAWAFWSTHPAHHWLFEGWAVHHGVPTWVGGGLTGLALFAGTTIIGWFGADLYPSKLHDVALLSLSGVLRMSFLAAVLVSPWPLVAGLLFGPAYWAVADLKHTKPWQFWGEFVCGAVIGACMAMA